MDGSKMNGNLIKDRLVCFSNGHIKNLSVYVYSNSVTSSSDVYRCTNCG